MARMYEQVLNDAAKAKSRSKTGAIIALIIALVLVLLLSFGVVGSPWFLIGLGFTAFFFVVAIWLRWKAGG